MPKWLNGKWPGSQTLWTLAALAAAVVALFAFHWAAGTVGLFVFSATAYFSVMQELRRRKELQAYIATISHRVKRATNELMNGMPIGVVLYDDEKRIEWHNPFIAKMLERDTVVGETVSSLWPGLKTIKDKESVQEIVLGKRMFRVNVKPEERLLFFTDITAFTSLSKRYEEEKPSLGILALDNVDEVTQGMDDQARSMVMAKVTTVINDWCARNLIYLRRTSSDRFLLLMNQRTLNKLEQAKFDVLDEVRDATSHLKLPVTVSIGVASGTDNLVELGHLAQTSLDIALGRGGDQVGVKVGQRINFYGGRSNAVEKRTRVRARVVAHAMRDLIKESDKLIIMGHKIPDTDAIGAAIGVLRAAETFGKEAYIVLEGVNPSIHRLMELIYEDEDLTQKFIPPEDAMEITTPRTLAVVVDTHRSTLVAEPRLLGLTNRLMVIDHHRRGEEFINDATLIYMEPYASSTCELVTELLQYIHDNLQLGVLEATALLSGIVTDTKSFSVRTGARTFEAASFLRRSGADSELIQRLMKDDLKGYMMKASIIRHAQIVHEHFAVAVTEPGQKYPQLLIAQVADTLLNMQGIVASFVISERTDGLIGISARSMGHVNVQVIMEQFGGGGHMTNAAAQVEGTLEQAKERLLAIINDIEEREGLFE
ncbi:DHH family phosphoesterase [Paenibacillus thermotolerans]|uniref:DHH family phosphoesterase n=1 Tax=Paenibacillus thermotolerans TaxID=3027807 RepID=UPI0023684F23|nr:MULTISPECIES: DHH family phosphoesterase [unclassified Paenibacillus]